MTAKASSGGTENNGEDSGCDPREVLRRMLETPPKPHPQKSERRGMGASPGTPETDADPRNPNRGSSDYPLQGGSQ
jgi:hypothetical protein